MHGWGEPGLASALPDQPLQIERMGYFVRDSRAHARNPGQLVFNRTSGLKDSSGK